MISIFRVPIYKQSCDPGIESSLIITERAQTQQTSFKSVCDFGEAQKQDMEEPFYHTDSGNGSQIYESHAMSRDSHKLENDNVQRVISEASFEDGQISAVPVAVFQSLLVNDGETASTLSDIHSEKVLSHDGVIKSDSVQADQLSSVKNLPKKNMRQGHVTDCAKYNWNGPWVDCSYIFMYVTDKRVCTKVHNGIAVVAEGEQHGYKDDRMLYNNDQSASAAHMAGSVNVSQPTADKVVSGVADSEHEALAVGNNARQKIPACDQHEDVLDSGYSVQVIADSGLLTKVDDLSFKSRSQDLAVGAQDAVSESTNSGKVSRLSADCDTRVVVNQLAISSEDFHPHECHILPGSNRDIIADSHLVSKQLSDIASSIENMEAWIRRAKSEIQSSISGEDASISLSAVEQYVSEVQKKKVELDQLNTQVKELEKFDKNVVRDERYHLVSVHSQLHSLSETLSTVASEAVRIQQHLVSYCS